MCITVETSKLRGLHSDSFVTKSVNKLFSQHIKLISSYCKNTFLNMTEIFSSLYGQTDAQGPSGPSGMGFGPGKPLAPPVPQNPVHMAMPIPHQLVDEGPPLRKQSAAMNEPFYLVRELPSEYISQLILLNMLTSLTESWHQDTQSLLSTQCF